MEGRSRTTSDTASTQMPASPSIVCTTMMRALRGGSGASGPATSGALSANRSRTFTS